jgi:hypothetical protein
MQNHTAEKPAGSYPVKGRTVDTLCQVEAYFKGCAVLGDTNKGADGMIWCAPRVGGIFTGVGLQGYGLVLIFQD